MAKANSVKTKTLAADKPVARKGKTGSMPTAPSSEALVSDAPLANLAPAASAPSLASSTPASVPSAAARPSADAVARRAYELFLSEGRPHGRHLEHWFQAESELRS